MWTVPTWSLLCFVAAFVLSVCAAYMHGKERGERSEALETLKDAQQRIDDITRETLTKMVDRVLRK